VDVLSMSTTCTRRSTSESLYWWPRLWTIRQGGEACGNDPIWLVKGQAWDLLQDLIKDVQPCLGERCLKVARVCRKWRTDRRWLGIWTPWC